MDSITHIVVGAVAGEALAKRSLGKQAMLLGALAQSLPDIDIVAQFWATPAEDLVEHRGFTHSILFLILASLALAYGASRLYRKHDMSFKSWVIFFGVEIFLHLFFDVMNAYGTGLFEPFSNARISFNVMFVADPLFTIWPLIAVVALLFFRMAEEKRKRWIIFGLAGVGLYLFTAIVVKLVITSQAEQQFHSENKNPERYFTSPTPLNIWLWSVVAERDNGFYIGYRSVFDSHDSPLQYFPKNDSLLVKVNDTYELKLMQRFTKGYYIVKRKEEKVTITDLRFGQIFGWIDPHAPFVFEYSLDQSEGNDLVLQRGRFTNLNSSSLTGTLKRIRGN